MSNPAYEPFEYVIRWFGRDGSDYLYLFYDAEIETKVTNEIVNEQDSAKIQSLVSKVWQSIDLHADDLSKSDLTIIGQIFEQTYVTRLLKSGLTERYAPEAGTFKYRLMDGRYSLDFSLTMPDIKTWK